MTLATTERARLITTFERLSPDAPTLCDGWTAKDLLVHLIMREIYPHHLAGQKLPKLSETSVAKQRELEATEYSDLIELFRHGRQKFSPLRLGLVDRYMNTIEYVVHHEDLRRAQSPVLGRVLSADEQAEIAKMLPMFGRLLLRKATETIEFRPTGHQPFSVGPSPEGGPTVTVSGTPLELILFAFGRNEGLKAEFTGDPAKVEKVKNMKKGI